MLKNYTSTFLIQSERSVYISLISPKPAKNLAFLSTTNDHFYEPSKKLHGFGFFKKDDVDE